MGGCQVRSFVMNGIEDRSNRWVRHGTGLRRVEGFRSRVLDCVVGILVFLTNQSLCFSLFRAFFPNEVINLRRLVFKDSIFASFNTWVNEVYWLWYIMCRPVFRQRSSWLLFTLLIIRPHYGTPPSKIDITCCLRISSSSSVGQPRDLRRLKINILL